MADTGHYENPNFFGFTSICKCNTTFHIDFWMRNSLPTLYWPLVITWTLIWYIFTARCYTECGIAMTSWPSVRPFVTFGYSDQIGLNTSKIISPLTSLWSSLCANTNIMDLLQSEHPQILAGIGVGYRKSDWNTAYVQYTPPTLTRRNCRVASCRRRREWRHYVVTCHQPQQHKKLKTGSRLPTGVFTAPTRRNSTSLLANLFRLVETVAI